MRVAMISGLTERVEEEVRGRPESTFFGREKGDGQKTTPEGDDILSGLEESESLFFPSKRRVRVSERKGEGEERSDERR